MSQNDDTIVFYRLRALDKTPKINHDITFGGDGIRRGVEQTYASLIRHDATQGDVTRGDVTQNNVTRRNVTRDEVIQNNVTHNDVTHNHVQCNDVIHKGVLRDDDATVTHIVCDSLTTRAWLSPIGVTTYPRPRSAPPPKKGRCPVKAEACEETVQRRARKTALLLGQRVHHVTQQGFPSDAVLKGTTLKMDFPNTINSIPQPMASLIPEVKVTDMTRPHTAQPCVGSTGEKVELPVRPKTGLAKSPPGLKPLMVRQNGRRDINHDHTLLRIQSACGIRSRRNESISAKGDLKTKSGTSHKEHSFASLEQLQKHLQKKIAGLPPGLHSHLNKIIHRHCVSDNPVSKSANAYTAHGQKGVSSGNTKGKRCTEPGILKPLLVDASFAPHSAQCSSYQCKNCFRACLASDDFRPAAKEKTNSKMAVKNNMADRKRRIHVIKREIPDAYMLSKTKDVLE